MENKLKTNTVLLVIIIILLASILGYSLLGDKSKCIVESEILDNKDVINQKDIKTQNQNEIRKNDYIYDSSTFGYRIGYSGIDFSKVIVENDGQKVNFFPNQSYIDSLEIVDSTYDTTKYIYMGTVTFGNNEYKKFKDNITPRHTYYFISGLQNNKAVFISVENDSDNPAYLDLASFEIKSTTISCNTGFETSAESKVVNEESPALITGFEKKCDNNYYITFDYLGPGVGTMYDIENGDGSYFTNTNLKLRTFKVDPNLKVKQTDNSEVLISTYLGTLKKFNSTTFNQNNAYLSLSGQTVFSVNIRNGIVVSMSEVYLP
jgi:hypothetical protein